MYVRLCVCACVHVFVRLLSDTLGSTSDEGNQAGASTGGSADYIVVVHNGRKLPISATTTSGKAAETNTTFVQSDGMYTTAAPATTATADANGVLFALVT